MKFSSTLWLATALTGVLAASAFADDKDALMTAEKAQLDAPAYRMKVTSTDPDTKEATAITLESIKPDLLHMKTEVGGKTQFEIVSDGKKAFMSQGGGEMQEAPPQVAGMIGMARQQASMEALTKAAQNVKLVGHDSLNGTPTAVYTFSSDMQGMHSTSKIWISEKDHRPLKAEGETQGEMQMPGQENRKIHQSTVVTFDYDPSIKITLPTK